MLADDLVQGTLQVMYELQEYLAAITGLPGVTVQPAAGAHGELTGMLIFAAYHKSQELEADQDPHPRHRPRHQSGQRRPLRLQAGADQVRGRTASSTSQSIAAVMDEETAGIMVTNPNTLGLFETNIREIADIVHAKGGLVYGDGANLNAVMGIINARRCGVDVMHLNLHKTFSTPHGGGGPGAGPVCVTEELTRFLPVPRAVKDGDQLPARLRPARIRSAGSMPSTAISRCSFGPTAISGPWVRPI